MSERLRDRGCFKGCAFGCIGFVVLLLGLGAILGLSSLRGAMRGVEMTDDRRTQTFTSTPATPEQIADARTGVALPVDERAPLGTGTGLLAIDFSMGELVVEPSDSDSFEIDARYDENRFELTERLEEDGDGNWTYSIDLEPKVRFFGFRNQVKNKITLRVPRNRFMNIEGDIDMGESRLDLGGLWLGTVELDTGMGEHTVVFAEATAAPLESLVVHGKMGQTNLLNVGNARPLRTHATHSMGELVVDLRGGPWLTDASVRASCSMGECRIHPPEGVFIDADRISASMGGRSVDLPDTTDLPADAPTVTLDLTVSMGEVRVR